MATNTAAVLQKILGLETVCILEIAEDNRHVYQIHHFLQSSHTRASDPRSPPAPSGAWAWDGATAWPFGAGSCRPASWGSPARVPLRPWDWQGCLLDSLLVLRQSQSLVARLPLIRFWMRFNFAVYIAGCVSLIPALNNMLALTSVNKSGFVFHWVLMWFQVWFSFGEIGWLSCFLLLTGIGQTMLLSCLLKLFGETNWSE